MFGLPVKTNAMRYFCIVMATVESTDELSLPPGPPVVELDWDCLAERVELLELLVEESVYVVYPKESQQPRISNP